MEMETLINVLIYIVSATFTWLFGKVSKEKGWNEELPIPIQNALIAVIVFALSVGLGYLLGLPVDFQYIALKLGSSLFGSFSATWGYDANKGMKELKIKKESKDEKGE